MENLEEIKQRKAEELQKQFQQANEEKEAEAQQINQQIMQIEAVVKSKMSKEAIQRYGNLKMAHPNKAVQALLAMSQLLRIGEISQFDDNTFKELLLHLQDKKKEIKITRK